MDSWSGASVPELPGRGPEPHIRDTATGELAVAAAGHEATMYACGVTPYDATHIGHAATFTAWDLLVRAWRDAGHEVTYVQNVTDVDDPLLERAARDSESWRDLADREIARYRADMAVLRVLPPARLIGAVEALPVIERFAGRLADRGSLYELERDLYFARSADAAFGAVSRLGTREMIALSAERGGDPGRPGKKDPLDCLVWLAARPGEPAWESPFGRGRPGWHVECAAIATEYLGVVFDVQAGGTDLIYPHHELTASHARVALAGHGAVFARRYAHAGMVRLRGEKMSKSLGNLVFVSSLIAAGADPMAIRLALLAHHYRADWEWTDAVLAAAAERLARWRAAVSRIAASSGRVEAGGRGGSSSQAGTVGGRGGSSSQGSTVGGLGGSSPQGSTVRSPAAADGVLAGVRARLADDLDAPGAVAVVDRWAAAVLGSAGPAAGPSGGELVRATVDALLGISL